MTGTFAMKNSVIKNVIVDLGDFQPRRLTPMKQNLEKSFKFWFYLEKTCMIDVNVGEILRCRIGAQWVKTVCEALHGTVGVA